MEENAGKNELVRKMRAVSMAKRLGGLMGQWSPTPPCYLFWYTAGRGQRSLFDPSRGQIARNCLAFHVEPSHKLPGPLRKGMRRWIQYRVDGTDSFLLVLSCSIDTQLFRLEESIQ